MKNFSSVIVVFIWALLLFAIAPDSAHPPAWGMTASHVFLAAMTTAGAWAMLASSA